MRNLWLFISKYNAFFLLIIFLIISFVLLVNNNSYQKASTFNSSNQFVGESYERVDKFTDYLSLGKTLDSLAAENARLRSQLKYSQYDTTLQKQTVADTITNRQYTYIVARVINNSIHQKNNYITINRGSLHAINKGMGVICPSGIVGVVQNVSPHFAVIRSLLHSDSRISASIIPGNAFGSLVWGEDNHDPRVAILQDIPNHVLLKKGLKVVTSEFSGVFPPGIEIGKVNRTGLKGGDSFLNIEVRLNTDFSTLQYVYVINNIMATEKDTLQATEINTP